jgi:endonuclease/exonuclease/phosphatase family metal-dependent hydrolase
MPLTLATFNVKDLFEETHTEKLDWTARMIARADADVMGLQEVGPAGVLFALLRRLPGYGEPVIGTPDARGIRCALISRLPIERHQVHTTESLDFPVFQAGDPPPFRIALRRGIVQARVAGIEIFVAHFKSRRPHWLRSPSGEAIEPQTALAWAEAEVRSLVVRMAEALYLRKLVDGAGPEVAVMGDLNDIAGSVPVSIVTGRDLSCCAERVPVEQRYSIMWGGRRSFIDHVLLSQPLADRVQDARFLNDELREHPFIPEGGPEPPPTCDSDHAPFVVRLA